MKKLILIVVVAVMALAGVGIVGAQGPEGGRGGRGGRGDHMDGAVMDILIEATGLDALALREARREGSQTLADLIAANGGDVAAVQAAIVAEIQAKMPTEAEITAHVEEMLNSNTPARGNRLGDRLEGNLNAVVEEVTGLSIRDLMLEARTNNQTLAEVIAANGGDVEALTEALTAEVTANHPRLSAEQVAERVENFLNRAGRGRRFGL